MQNFDIEQSNLNKELLQPIQNIISYKELFEVIAPLGFITYGGPMAHIAIYKERFVETKKWLKEDEFVELFGICQSLPGPTSTQLLIAIGTLATQSWKGGLLAFILFSVPSAIFMLIAGLILGQTQDGKVVISEQVQHLLQGFQFAAIAIVAQAGWKLSIPIFKDKFQIALWGSSALIYLMFQTIQVMLLLILMGAVLNVVYQRVFNNVQISFSPNTNSKEIQKQMNVQGDFFMGWRSVQIYLSLFAVFLLLRYLFGTKLFITMESFYAIGSLIIGGGHVVLPMILTQFKLLGWITDEQFWNGFSLVSCMPGPLFNIAIYVGAVIGGFFIAIISWICLFLPAFFVIWGLLPFWKQYRNIQTVQHILAGISAIAVGFVITAVILLFINASHFSNYFTTTVLCVISFYVLEKYKASVPLVIITVGIFYVVVKAIV